VLMTCCLRAARFLSSSATRDSSNDAVADWHAHGAPLCSIKWIQCRFPGLANFFKDGWTIGVSVTWVADHTSSCWS